MTPPLVTFAKPGGSAPPEVSVHVYGGVPPLAPSVTEYAAFTTAGGNAVVVMVSVPAVIVMLMLGEDATKPVESFT
jgi:hypothetical protein